MPRPLAFALALPVAAAFNSGGMLPLVLGHRGYAAAYPENTMISFQAALANGADGIESDLRLSSDGVLVLMHDDTLNRTTNCTGAVSSYTYAQLQTCNANYAAKYGDQFGFVPIPRFEDAVALVAATQSMFILDLKDVVLLGQYIRPIVDKYGAASRVVMSCWTFEQMADAVMYMNASARQLLNETAPALVNGTSQSWGDYMALGLRGFSLEQSFLTPDFIQQAHARLLPVTVWTVDDPSLVNEMTDMGIDAIITNDAPTVSRTLRDRRLDGTGIYTRGEFATAVAASVFASLAVGAGVMYIIMRRKKSEGAEYHAVAGVV